MFEKPRPLIGQLHAYWVTVFCLVISAHCFLPATKLGQELSWIPCQQIQVKKILDFSVDLPYLKFPEASETFYNLRGCTLLHPLHSMLGKETPKIFEQLTLVMQLGLTMVGCIGLGFLIGYYVDKWLGIKGIFLTIFILLGIAGGGFTVYRQIKELEAQDTDGSAEDDAP